MTSPIHTTQHVRSLYQKYQIIAVSFTVITLTTAFLTAISGFQISKLERQFKQSNVKPPAKTEPAPVTPVAEVPTPDNDSVNQKIADLENQLIKERRTSQNFKAKIQELEKVISATKSVQIQKSQPLPTKQSQAVEKVSKKTQVPEKPEKKDMEPSLTVQPSPSLISEPTKEQSIVKSQDKKTTLTPSIETNSEIEKVIGIPQPASVAPKETETPPTPAQSMPLKDSPDTETQEDAKNPDIHLRPSSSERAITGQEESLSKDNINITPSKNKETTPLQDQNTQDNQVKSEKIEQQSQP